MAKTETSERSVVFGHVDEDRLGETMARQQNKDNFGLNSIAAGVPKFTKVEDYTTFLAEYAMQDGNIVVHFFPPPDFRGSPSALKHYWESLFAASLDAVAQDVFQATAPRLQAKYTEELQSWWLRAFKYDHIIDLKGFVQRFLDQLDASLESSLSSGSAGSGRIG